jgi:hypothetical protein
VLGGLEITHGQIVPAADLPSFGVHVTTGEGSTFSGRAGPKTFISVGIGETGLGTGAAYADAARTLGHYNIKLVPLSELEAEARRLKTIVENFEHPRAHDRFGDPVPRLSKAQFQEHLDKVDRELSRRAALPPDSPGRLGGAGAADNYPILLEFDPTNLHAVPRPDVSADQAGVLSGEASISARIDLPKRLQRAYAPAARVAELRVRLTAILGHGNFEVVALEGLDALPDAGVIGTTRQLTLGNLQGLEADFEQQQAAYLDAAMKKAQRRRPRP